MPDTTQRLDVSQYLTFRACGEVFALPILRVREIIEHRPITRVPGAVSWAAGVINLRGKVIPVVDLALRLGLPPTAIGRRTCVVIVEAGVGGAELVVGVMVDSVCEVIEFRHGEIEPPPAFGTSLPAEYLSGLGRLEQGFVLVLDADRVFDTGGLGATESSQAEPAEARTE
jgi:purine-binding chemotaxis protein CheW